VPEFSDALRAARYTLPDHAGLLICQKRFTSMTF
jgi:hypothetical protein